MAEYHITDFPAEIASSRTVIKHQRGAAAAAFCNAVWEALAALALLDTEAGWSAMSRADAQAIRFQETLQTAKVEFAGRTILLERVA